MPASLSPKCCGELEAQIGRAVIHFEKEFMGRGPLETKAYLLDDMILVRLKGVLTPAERKLAQSQNERCAYLLKQVRNELLAAGRSRLEAAIRAIVGVEVQSIHTDISTKTGERIIVMTLQRRPQIHRDREQSADPSSAEVSPVPSKVTPDCEQTALHECSAEKQLAAAEVFAASSAVASPAAVGCHHEAG